MLIDVTCPHCQDTIPVTESATDQKIDCPGCGKKMVVPGAGQPAGTSPSKSKERPRRDDRPSTSKRRSYRDDDDDDRPRRRRGEEAGSGGMLGLLIAGGIGLFLLAVGFGITAWLIFSGKKEPEVAENSKPEEKRAESRPNTAPPPQFNTNPPKNVPGLPQRNVDDDPPLTPKGNRPDERPRFEPPPRVEPPPVRKPQEPEVPNAPPPAPPAPAVNLPAAAEQIVIGAGGKLMFLHLKGTRQVAAFDPVEKKIVKYVSLLDDDLLLAAGQEHLVLAYPKLKRLDRIPLATNETDKTMVIPSKWPLRGIALGAASTGPLLAAAGDFPFGDELFLIDLAKMKRFDNTVIPNPGVHPDAAMKLWAAHDGRCFSATSGGLSKPMVYQIRPNGWQVYASPCNPPALNADGDLVFGGSSIATFTGQAVGEKKGERGKAMWYLPAAQGPFFLSLNEATVGKWPNEKKWGELQVHAGRDQRPLITLPELPEMKEFADFFFMKTVPLEQHIFYFPFTNTLAILPVARDKIHLRTIDLKSELSKSKNDYLVVVSRPPKVKVGETFKYTPEVWSRSGGVKLRLDAGPTGMKLDNDTLTWAVPAKFDQVSTNVILTITDGSGKEMFHSFDVAVFPAKKE